MGEQDRKIDWLEQARRAYIGGADRKISDLDQAIAVLEIDPASPDAREDLRVLLHNLIGSGASYGFPAISIIARKMSSALKRATDDRIIIESGLTEHLRHGLSELTEAFAKECEQLGD